MEIQEHRASTTISFVVESFDMRQMRLDPHGTLPTKQETRVLRVRQARNGTLRIYFNGRVIDKEGLVSQIISMPSEVLAGLNNVLDSYAVQEFTDEQCEKAIRTHPYADEIMHPAMKRGTSILVTRTVLRVAYAQMPIFISLMKPTENNVGEHILNDFYYDDGETIYSDTQGFMFASTMKEFVYRAFGFWRKDLVRLISQTPMRSVLWVSWFKDGLTPDQIVRVLTHYRDNPLDDFAHTCLERRLVRNVVRDIQHPTSLYNLALGKRMMEFDQNHTLGAMWIEGVLDPNIKVNGWDSLLDHVMRASAEALKGMQAHIPEGFFMLEGIESNGYSLHILRDAHDYFSTGKEMGVCVGSIKYLKSAADGDALHVRFDKGKEMSALLDLRKAKNPNQYYVEEFRGQKNSLVQDQKLLLDLVSDRMQYDLVPAQSR